MSFPSLSLAINLIPLCIKLSTIPATV